MDAPAARPIDLDIASPDLRVERRPDGAILLRSGLAAPACPRQLGDVLKARAAAHPGRAFLAERDEGGGWRRLGYGEAAARADRISEGLLDRLCEGEAIVAAVAENSIEVALLMLGAMQAGIAFLPISPAYAQHRPPHERLRQVLDLMRPAMIYVAAPGPMLDAVRATMPAGTRLIVGQGRVADAVAFADLEAAAPGKAFAEAFARVGGDTVAKYLMTSGSTATPKGVANTQRMLCFNGASIDAAWPFLTRRPPVLVDWLPWSHTFGANYNFNMVLRNGGTLYLDRGKPVPGLFEETLRNLRDVRPTMINSVPRYYDMLLPHLERDPAFARHLLERLDLAFYAAAALPLSLRRRFAAVAVAARGRPVAMVSSLGATETAPAATIAYDESEDGACIGLPLPGVEIKLAPTAGKYEFRVRGPIVTPGYYARPDLTAAAFDEEGFFRMGDAVRFVDPARPERGIAFDGRISENFKLTSGTWVQVSEVRLAAIAAASPVVQDVVVAGEGRDAVAVLVFPSPEGCRSLLGGVPGADGGPLSRNPLIRDHVAQALARYNEGHPASSARITRAMILDEAPSPEAGEITEKGYLNQRGVLQRRAACVEALFREPAPADVLVVG